MTKKKFGTRHTNAYSNFTEICPICVANKARRGYYREHGMDNYTNSTLQMLGLDSWFGSYIRATQYMSTKALAVLELKYSIILNWYRVYYPREYQRIMTDYNA